MLTADRLRELLHYDPATGLFTWRVTRGRTAKVGATAGRVNSQGYWNIDIDGKTYKAHRLAFLYITGAWPAHDGEHRNRIRSDNRWENLRPATRSENNCNSGLRKDNSLGVKGVSRNRKGFQANIKVNGERIYLGTFATIAEAKAIRDRAARDLHGEFARAAQ